MFSRLTAGACKSAANFGGVRASTLFSGSRAGSVRIRSESRLVSPPTRCHARQVRFASTKASPSAFEVCALEMFEVPWPEILSSRLQILAPPSRPYPFLPLAQ
jgi:hypothetical protein